MVTGKKASRLGRDHAYGSHMVPRHGKLDFLILMVN